MIEINKKNKNMVCACDEWFEGMEQVIRHTMNALIHHGSPYTAAQFRFCPWCGTPLVEEEGANDQ